MQHSYAVLADHIKAAIRTHEYRVGDRLPSVRELAAAQGVSVSTATRCYRLLEHEGYAQARYKSGMYVADWKALRQARAAPRPRRRPRRPASSTTCWPRCSTE